MFDYILLAVSIVSSILACAVARNNFSKQCMAHDGDLYAFNTISAAISLVTLFIISLVKGELCVPSAYTAVMGALYGISTAMMTLLNMRALQTGPLSYTNIIIFCALIIPALSGMVLYGEPVSFAQYVGVALMLLSFTFSVDKSQDNKSMNLRWLLLCIGAFLFNGAVGVMQKLHQNSAWKAQLGMFLLIAFAVYALLCLALTLFTLRKNEPMTAFSPQNRSKTLLYVSISGVGIAVCNQINTYLAGVMPSILFFPLVNGVMLLATLLIGFFIWKESFTKKQWIGLAAGIVSIVLLSGLF